jgi:hypothetical protein
VRLWLSERERRPDPPPARADARKALAAGTALWLALLLAVLVLRDRLDEATVGLLVPTAAIGAVLGLAGLAVVQLRRRRTARASAEGREVPEPPASDGTH